VDAHGVVVRKPEKLPSGRYKVRFRGPGVSPKTGKLAQSSETFDRKKDADQFCVWLHALGPQGALDLLYEAEQDKEVPTLDELAADHIAHLTGVEPGTRKTYERLWARTWGPQFGSTRAHRITTDQIRVAINHLELSYSRKSLENQRGLLAGVLSRAVEKGYLAKNPAKGVRLPRGRESERVEMRILTPDEFADVEAAMHPHYRPILRFLWGTGCRWGEAVALQVSDLQRGRNERGEVEVIAHIRRAVKWSPDGQRRTAAPKTKRSNRRIVIPPDLHAELEQLCAGKDRGDLVFTASRGGEIRHRTFWSRYWLPAVAGLEPRPRIHDLRHSHASWLLGRGVAIHVVQARLGHESIKTTVDTYSHLLPDAQSAAAAAAALAFGHRPPELT
jgi:integrase